MRPHREHADFPELRKRLGHAFHLLRAAGYVARQNFMCCQGCGFAALPEGTTKAVFYHRQDADGLRGRGLVYLSWGGDGREILAALGVAKLAVEWDGSDATRFCVRLPDAKVERASEAAYANRMWG